LHIEGPCLAFEPSDPLEADLDLVLGNSLFDILPSVAQHSIDQTGQMVSHGDNGFWGAQAAFEGAILRSERCLAVSQALCAQPQRVCSSIVNFALERRSTLPPLTELFGQSPRKELNCFSVFQRVMSKPTSEIMI
jgi:hypothetical protein